MKAFLFACVTAAGLAVVAAFVLNDTYQRTIAEATTTSGVRLDEPGDNLVEWQ